VPNEAPLRHRKRKQDSVPVRPSSGYLPDDASYDQVSYEIVRTRAKRGCVEDAVVNGLLSMMAELF